MRRRTILIGGHSRNHRRMPMPYRATLPGRSKRGAVQDQTQHDLKNFRPTISIMGFYDDPVNVLSYLALACLVFMMPNGKRQTNSARIFVVGFVAYLVFTWPNFLRNFK